MALLCRQCAGPLRAQSRFCASCGAPVVSAASESEVLIVAAPMPPASLRARASWSELRSVLWLFTALLAISLASGLLSRVTTEPVLEVGGTLATALVVMAFVASRWPLIAPLLRQRPTSSSLGWVALVGALTALVLQGYFAVLEALGTPFVRYGDTYTEYGWPVWSAYVVVSLCPAVFEELAFRGVVQGGLEAVLSRRDAWLVQAGMFGVLHLAPVIFPSHVLMGLYFGWVRLRTQSIYPSMLLHAAWNAAILFAEIN